MSASQVRRSLREDEHFLHDEETLERIRIRREKKKPNFDIKRRLLHVAPEKREKTARSVFGKFKISKSLKAEQAKYAKLSKEFLARPENRFCVICIARRDELGEKILLNPASEIHHYAGRIGRLLCYIPFWKPSCLRCRPWPHDNKALARSVGMLCPSHEYNVFPGEKLRLTDSQGPP